VTTLQSSHDDSDPRRLRGLLLRLRDMAWQYSITSVVVGMAGFEGDPLYPEIVDFIESALRVDDAVLRITRERTVLFLADVDQTQTHAEAIMERILLDFRERFPAMEDPAVSLGYFEVTPELRDVSVKKVLPAVFAAPPGTH
jgi:hypothetical protein